MGGQEWTEKELEVLCRDYPHKGSRALAKSLNRSLSSVKSKAKKLKLLRLGRRPSTEQEREIIRLVYPEHGAAETARRLNRSPMDVRKKAQYMGVKYLYDSVDFTKEEVEYIRNFYPSVGPSDIAKTLGRTPESIRAKAQILKVGRPLKHRWILHELGMSSEQLAYMAGLIDGEGTVGIKRTGKRNPIPHVLIASTSGQIVNWVMDRLKAPNVVVAQRPGTPGRGYSKGRILNSWVVSFRGYRFLSLYKDLLKYMTVKKPQMEMIVEWSEIRLSQTKTEKMTERAKLLQRMIRFMNLRGFGISPDEKFAIYQSSTWEPALEIMKQLGI